MSSSKAAALALAPEHRRQLLEAAAQAIGRGLAGERLGLSAAAYPAALRVTRASFVTLHLDADLRGCIGTLEARRALIEDVVYNAYAAAFEDPRFPPLGAPEFERLAIHISILSLPEPLAFGSEAELLAQLRPRIDGLVLEEGFYRGTFLPAVWEQLPEPREFLRSLKRKAGLPADYWSQKITVKRYVVESVP